MKKYLLSLLLPATLLCLLAACGNKTNSAGQSVCDIHVKVAFPEYTRGCLQTPEGTCLDTLAIDNGVAAMQRTDSTQMPYVAVIRLENPADSLDFMEMPVVVEGGEVAVEIGEYITTSGTLLNQQLQQFLNELQATLTAAKNNKEIKGEEIDKLFSAFYRQQILANKDNVVGKYIYGAYGSHLKGDDVAAVKAAFDNK